MDVKFNALNVNEVAVKTSLRFLVTAIVIDCITQMQMNWFATECNVKDLESSAASASLATVAAGNGKYQALKVGQFGEGMD